MSEIIAFDDHFTIREKKCQGNGGIISVEFIPVKNAKTSENNRKFLEEVSKKTVTLVIEKD